MLYFQPVISLTNASFAAVSCILPPDSLMITGFCGSLGYLEGQWDPVEPDGTGRFTYGKTGTNVPLVWDAIGWGEWWFGTRSYRISTDEAPQSGSNVWDMECLGDWEYHSLTITPFTVYAASCEAGHEPVSPTMCAPCPPGSSGPTTSTEKCTPCPASTFAPDSGSSACQACPSSLTSLQGASREDECYDATATTCSPGEGNIGWAANHAYHCDLSYPGRPGCQLYSDKTFPYCLLEEEFLDANGGGYVGGWWTSAFEWRECDPLLDNSVVCVSCNPGSYKPSTSAYRCTPCAGGTFNPERGSADRSACQACEAGKASVTSGASDPSVCVPCVEGTWAPAGSVTCGLCPLGTFNSVHGSGSITDCQACPDGMSSLSGATTASECFDDSGTFNLFVAEGSSNRVSTFSRSTFGFAPVFQGLPLNAPYSIVFISAIHFVVASTATDQILKFMYDGTYVGVFASVSEPRGLLLLPDLDPPQVAAAVTVTGDSYVGNWGEEVVPTEKKIVFLSADSGSAVGEVAIPLDAEVPYVVHDLAAVGGASDQLLVSLVSRNNGGEPRYMWLTCVPNTQCSDSPKQIGYFNDEVAADFTNPPRIAKISSRSTYFLTCGRSVYECQVSASYITGWSCPPCPVFISGLPVSSWMPGALLVDEKKEILFVSDVESSKIHSFDFDGQLIGTVTTPSAATSMAVKNGGYSPLAELTPPETTSTASTIGLTVSLRDRYGDPLPPNYDIAPEISRLSLTAYGSIQISDDVHIPVPIEGAVSLDAATVNITFAGEWRLELMENFALSSQHVGSSPLTFTVDPGPTALSACTLDYDSSITAGDSLTVTLKTHDEYDNPTDHAFDAFTAEVGGEVNDFSRSASGTYTLSHRFTQTGAEIFKVAGVGQFGLDVSPSLPDALSSVHNIKAGTELISEKEQRIDLRVFPKDQVRRMMRRQAKECGDRRG